jgi:ABC-2 type transport system ATP-binding protein
MARAIEGIEVRELVRQFKDVRAVDGIELTISPGEIYGFLGPNGAGKSTTVHMLTTLLPPTSGTARVGGFDVVKDGPNVRRTIGAALQEAALDPFLTGREHVRLQASLHGIRGDERKRRMALLLDRVGLTHAADRKVQTYSGGMKRRLDLALALVHDPQILFLDEPTTGLDPQSRSALWEEVGRLAKDEGVTVFLTTQYLEEADVLADRVGIIDHGHIVAEGTPAQLKAEIGKPTVEVVPEDDGDRPRLGTLLAAFGETTAARPGASAVQLDDDRTLADVIRALDNDGIRAAALAVHQPTLDDVFLAKTGRSLEGSEDGDAARDDAAEATRDGAADSRRGGAAPEPRESGAR